jgi:hypothetical protein
MPLAQRNALYIAEVEHRFNANKASVVHKSAHRLSLIIAVFEQQPAISMEELRALFDNMRERT